MRVKRLLLITMAVILVAGLSLSLACATPAPAPAPTPTPTPAPAPAPAPAPTPDKSNWPKVITITTPGTGGALAVYGTAVAAVIEKYTGVVATPQPTSGGQEAQELFVKGEAQMWATNARDFIRGYLGDEPESYTPGPDKIRWFSGAYSAAVHFPVLEKSGIKTFADLKGKRCMFDRPNNPTWWEVFPNVLKAYGLTVDDITVMPALSYKDAVQALKEGTADTTMQYGSPPIPLFAELAQTNSINLLSIDPDKQKQVLDAIPFEYIKVIPANTYKGQTTDTHALHIGAPIGIGADLPDDFVYAAIKAVVEHFDEIQAAHASFKKWQPADLAANPVAPYHAGVLKYYKEQGFVTPEFEQKHNDMLKQMNQAK